MTALHFKKANDNNHPAFCDPVAEAKSAWFTLDDCIQKMSDAQLEEFDAFVERHTYEVG